jgi:hypothetical protein
MNESQARELTEAELETVVGGTVTNTFHNDDFNTTSVQSSSAQSFLKSNVVNSHTHETT